jgi:hypothetical protein
MSCYVDIVCSHYSKGKNVTVLKQAPHHESICSSGGMNSCIPNWSWVVSTLLQSLYFGEGVHCTQEIRSWAGPRAGLAGFAEQKGQCLSIGIESHILDHPAHSLVIVHSEQAWLPLLLSIYFIILLYYIICSIYVELHAMWWNNYAWQMNLHEWITGFLANCEAFYLQSQEGSEKKIQILNLDCPSVAGNYWFNSECLNAYQIFISLPCVSPVVQCDIVFCSLGLRKL